MFSLSADNYRGSGDKDNHRTGTSPSLIEATGNHYHGDNLLIANRSHISIFSDLVTLSIDLVMAVVRLCLCILSLMYAVEIPFAEDDSIEFLNEAALSLHIK